MARSLSRVAEDLVRAGSGDGVRWGEFTLATHFQSIYSVRLRACVGYEALVRATDEAGRPVAADALFDDSFARSEGPVLDWVCRALHLRNFAVSDAGDRKLFMNVHPQAAVADAARPRELEELIRYYGVAPKRVCVEILRNSCTDEARLVEAVAAYRAMGATIVMDDFGSGRSNLDRLAALRPDLVKIDRSVLTRAVGDAKSRQALPGVIELLHESGAQVAMEGVESAGEALLAVDAGADLVQGSYFAKPGPRPVDDELTNRILGQLSSMGQSFAAVGDD